MDGWLAMPGLQTLKDLCIYRMDAPFRFVLTEKGSHKRCGHQEPFKQHSDQQMQMIKTFYLIVLCFLNILLPFMSHSLFSNWSESYRGPQNHKINRKRKKLYFALRKRSLFEYLHWHLFSWSTQKVCTLNEYLFI